MQTFTILKNNAWVEVSDQSVYSCNMSKLLAKQTTFSVAQQRNKYLTYTEKCCTVCYDVYAKVCWRSLGGENAVK